MDVLRIKLQSLLQQAPTNQRTLKEVSRLIVKWSVKKYRLDRVDRIYLKAAVMSVLELYSGIPLSKSERIPETTEKTGKTN
jgi:hypothetical protein